VKKSQRRLKNDFRSVWQRNDSTVLINHFKEVQGLTVKAVTDIAQADEHVKDLCEKNRIQEHYHDVNTMLQDPEIDTIYVAVPNVLHYAYCKRALLAGKHVICEKPFTSNFNEAQDLAKIAKEKGLILVEAVTTHYVPNMKKIIECLPNVGDLKMVVMNYSSYSSRYDKFKEGVVLPVFNPKMSGGALMDANIYNLHFLVHLFGKPLDIAYYPNIDKGIDTSGVLVLDYGTFKCVAIGTKDCQGPVSVNIEGDKGYIHIPFTVNNLQGFSFHEESGNRMVEKTNLPLVNYNGKHFHMYYEFSEFERIIREHDLETSNRMLEISLAVSQLQTKVRKDTGIIFEADSQMMQ